MRFIVDNNMNNFKNLALTFKMFTITRNWYDFFKSLYLYFLDFLHFFTLDKLISIS